MAGQNALRLRVIDLLAVAGIAIAALWAGQIAGPHLTDRLIGAPVPDVAYEVAHDVPSTKDEITSLEDQEKVVDYQMAFTTTLLIREHADLPTASAAEAGSLRAQIEGNSTFLARLEAQAKELGKSLDKDNEDLAAKQYLAQKDAAWSSSLRRAGAWGIEAAGSYTALAILGLALLCLRKSFKDILHSWPVFIGAAGLLFGLLVTIFTEWIGLLLLAILILIPIARGRTIDRAHA